MNQQELNQLEEFTQNLDFLFQEGVLFTTEQKKKIQLLANEILAITNDSFFVCKD
jgi:hypothetical protein